MKFNILLSFPIFLIIDIENNLNLIQEVSMFQKKVLNVGGNLKKIKLPKQYNDYEHILLDIDPKGKPDIVCDALKMKEAIPPNSFDAIYCSQNWIHSKIPCKNPS